LRERSAHNNKLIIANETQFYKQKTSLGVFGKIMLSPEAWLTPLEVADLVVSKAAQQRHFYQSKWEITAKTLIFSTSNGVDY